jgi:hypothetical protein
MALQDKEIELLELLVQLGHESYEDYSLRGSELVARGELSQMTLKGHVVEEIFASRAGLWDDITNQPTADFQRIIALLNHSNYADIHVVKSAGLKEVNTWSPSVRAISDVRELQAERSKTGWQRFKERVSKKLDEGLDEAIKKSVYVFAAGLFGLVGGIIGGVLQGVIVDLFGGLISGWFN